MRQGTGPSRSWPYPTVLGLLGLSELVYLGLFLPVSTGPMRFFIVSLLACLPYVAFCWLVVRKEDQLPAHIGWLLLGFGLLFRLTLIGSGPLVSDDLFRYLWDGKVQAHGLNPFRYAPLDPALQHLHSSLLPQAINFPWMPTIYPPLAQGFFRLAYRLGGEHVLAFKSLLLLAEVATLLLLRRLLSVEGLSPARLGFYAACPLPILQFMVDGHLDALVFPFLLLFLLFWRRRQNLSAMVALGGAILVKLLPLIALPLLLREARGRQRMLFLGIPLVLLALGYWPFLSDGHPFESLRTFTLNWTFNGSLEPLIQRAVGGAQLARMLVTGLLAAWVLWLAAGTRPLIQQLHLAFLGVLLLAPVVHPWYVTWLAVLLPLHFRWSSLAFIVLAGLANWVGVQYRATGVWATPAWLPWLEYGPVYLLLLSVAFRQWTPRTTVPGKQEGGTYS